MPLWRDPLEELIEGLERAVPAETAVAVSRREYPPLGDIQRCIGIVANGSEQERRALRAEPRFARVLAYFRDPYGYINGAPLPALGSDPFTVVRSGKG